jgi:RNA polymerase sigma-70 factor (ECF subfamily)
MGAYPEDAEDIIQDTVIKFWENMDRIEPRKVKAWLFKVAINNYYTLRRKRKNVLQVKDALREQLCTESEPLLSTDRTELMIQVKDIYSQMSDSEKTLLILKYHHDLSYKEIAAFLNTTEETVKTSLSRARKSFKKLWEGDKSAG